MAMALRARGEERQTVAIIGDGAMTAGLSFEALNHAGHEKADMLVILNDNDMSISNNVGALNKYFTRIWSSRTYSALREGSKRVLEKIPAAWEFARRTEEHMKGMVAPGTLFEELGFNYYGPIDGHDLDELVLTLNNLKKLKGPRFLHVVTRKGKGFEPAEQDPIGYHALKSARAPAGVKKPTYSNVFGQWLCDMAAADERLIGITPAMREGSDLIRFSQEYPDRYIDVAIAEQHAVTLAAGLACEGVKPVVAIYSTFLQRAYDQLIHDVALQNLDVLFAIDRAGLVGEDGPTHHGAYDLSYLRCIPGMVIMTPSDENECRQMLYTGYIHEGPAAVRYPRGSGTGVVPDTEMQALALGKGIIRRQGNAAAGQRVALLAFGAPLAQALQAAEALDATVADMRFVKPLDHELVAELTGRHDLLVTLEDNAVQGGAGSAVLESLAAAGLSVPVLTLGIPDRYIEHASPAQQQQDIGLDVAGILAAVAGYRSRTGAS
jgi:1-deoxy-D-xylulose-5-phosphate synthase